MSEFSERPIKATYADSNAARHTALPTEGSSDAADTLRHRVILNMLRDAYDVGADAKLQSGFDIPDNDAVIKLLPQNKRDVLRPDYYKKCIART